MRRRIQWQGLSKWIKRIVEIADLPRRLCLLSTVQLCSVLYVDSTMDISSSLDLSPYSTSAVLDSAAQYVQDIILDQRVFAVAFGLLHI